MKLAQLLDCLPERLSDWLSPKYVVTGDFGGHRVGVTTRKLLTDAEAVSLLVRHRPMGFRGRIDYLGMTRL